MSGGHFDYDQYKMYDIAEEIKHLIQTNGKEVNGYVRPEYSYETMQEFAKAYCLLLQAHAYVQRIDWLISGDDSEDTFHKRLAEELISLPAEFTWQSDL